MLRTNTARERYGHWWLEARRRHNPRARRVLQQDREQRQLGQGFHYRRHPRLARVLLHVRHGQLQLCLQPR